MIHIKDALEEKMNSIKGLLESEKLKLVIKDGNYYLKGHLSVSDFCSLCNMDNSALYTSYKNYFVNNKKLRAIQLNVEAIKEISSNGLVDSILSFAVKDGDTPIPLDSDGIDSRTLNKLNTALGLIKKSLLNGVEKLEQRDGKYYLVDCSMVRLARLSGISSFSLCRDRYKLYFINSIYGIEIDIGELKKVLGDQIVNDFLNLDKPVDDVLPASPQTAASSGNDIIEIVLRNLKDTTDILYFIKENNLEGLFNKYQILGVCFTRVYEITKELKEKGRIENFKPCLVNAGIINVDIDEKIESLKLLITLTKMISKDEKIKEILERNSSIFTIVTENLFGLAPIH